MQRFVFFLIWTVSLTFLYWGVVGLLVDRLSGWMPDAVPLLDEFRRYGWMIGVVLAILTAVLLV